MVDANSRASEGALQTPDRFVEMSGYFFTDSFEYDAKALPTLQSRCRQTIVGTGREVCGCE